ncbi:hypothetical protein R1flu_008316 [Riccia fluitans]|uniref:DUF1421 domain-containing protein n=1 Tax=Riccia fluitans TaxID=41844 RepID=A0ABD1YBD8_9MARC
MDSSAGIVTNHQSAAQKEPFFDLLLATSSSVSSFNQIPSQSSTRKMEDTCGDFDFGGGDNVLPSFDFQPVRSSGVPQSKISSAAGRRMEEGISREDLPPSSYASYEPVMRRSREPPPTYESPVPREHENESLEIATIAAVERTMKKYADNLLRVLEGLTGRLSQLESSTQRLEHLFGEVRKAVGISHDETDGKLRSLENHVLEVQRGVQLLRDRQELAEAQSQLAKLQAVTKSEAAPPTSGLFAPPPVPEQLAQSTRGPPGKVLLETSQQQQQNSSVDSPSHYQQALQQLQLPSSFTMPSPPQSIPLQPPQTPQQQQQLQQPSDVLPPTLHQQLQQQPLPPPQPSQQMTHSQQHPHKPLPPGQMQPFYGQQQSPVQPPPPSLPVYGHQSEGPAYSHHPQGSLSPSQSYAPDVPSYHPASYASPGPVPQPQRQSSQIPPTPHIQQQHSTYDSSTTRTLSGQLALPPPYLSQVSSPPVYDPQSPGSGYPSSSYRVAQPLTGPLHSVPSSIGGGGYPRLPVAQPLPHALPAGGGDPPGTPLLSTNRVPIDEVIEKVTQMGFLKDQVRAVVRRLTENGQSVDLNIVLDKLMNGMNGDAQPPQKGWFGG